MVLFVHQGQFAWKPARPALSKNSCVLRHEADLLELAALQGHALGTHLGRGLGDDDDQFRVDAVGDEGLLAVEHVVVALAPRRGAHGLEVAARAGLGHGDGADQLARGHARQPAVLLHLAAIGMDVGRDDVRMQRKAQPAGARARDLLQQHGRMAEVAAAAIGLGQHGVEQAFAPGLAPDLLGHDALALPFGMVGHDLALEEAAGLLAELFMVFAVDGALGQVLHGSVSGGCR